jgi:uncharacterized CHY-type Zn-finger protein
MEKINISKTNQAEVICKNCAGKLNFSPGTANLKCEFCGTENYISVNADAVKEAVAELDYFSYIQNQIDNSAIQEIHTVQCHSCGAMTTFNQNITSSACPFCASPIVAKQGQSNKQIEPKALIPFRIDSKNGTELLRQWLVKLWWAPTNLKKQARQSEKLTGMYIPYWTYDVSTRARYKGERGEDYSDTEYYTDSDGKSQTRTVTKTSWTSVTGDIHHFFDDVLVVATNSLSEKYIDDLEPWRLTELMPYDDKFIAGFCSESYQIDVKTGFETGKHKMEIVLREKIRKDIGGDHQRIHSINTEYNDIKFKHILLPVWISAYRYADKAYRFMINGQTGKVLGERPYSWIKITFAVLSVISMMAVAYYLLTN